MHRNSESFSTGANIGPMSSLELYLMGLVPADEVEDIDRAVNATTVNISKGLFEATEIVSITIDDIIVEHGERTPAYPNTQRDFRGALILVTLELPTDDVILTLEPTHKLLLAAGADCILELAAMFCAQ